MSQYVTGAGVAQNKGGRWGIGYKLNPSSVIHKSGATPPVLNTPYTLCDIKGNIKAYQMAVVQTNTETAAKNLEINATIDGVAVTPFTWSAANGTVYIIALSVADFGSGTAPTRSLSATSVALAPAIQLLGTMPLECGALQITITLKTAAGTAQLLDSFLETAVH